MSIISKDIPSVGILMTVMQSAYTPLQTIPYAFNRGENLIFTLEFERLLLTAFSKKATEEFHISGTAGCMAHPGQQMGQTPPSYTVSAIQQTRMFIQFSFTTPQNSFKNFNHH